MMASVATGFAQSVAATRSENRPSRSGPRGHSKSSPRSTGRVDQAMAQSLVGKDIPFFETMTSNPGRAPSPKPIGTIQIAGTRLTDGGRTIDSGHRSSSAGGSLCPACFQPSIMRKVTYDLSGVEATWSAEEDPADAPRWSGWWPRLDSDSLRLLSRGSKPHDEGLGATLKTRPTRTEHLAPPSPGSVKLRLDGSVPIVEAMIGDVQAEPGDPAIKREAPSRHADSGVQGRSTLPDDYPPDR